MFYIFNAQRKCISSCNAAPSEDDLVSRGEVVMEYSGECRVGWLLDEQGVPCAPIIPPPTPLEMAEKARQERDARLTEFDRELYRNQFFWSTLTTDQQTDRLAYRQALLDVPQQSGFPTDISWPAYPTL